MWVYVKKCEINSILKKMRMREEKNQKLVHSCGIKLIQYYNNSIFRK